MPPSKDGVYVCTPLPFSISTHVVRDRKAKHSPLRMEKHTVEFNQVAMANSDGSEAMLNRVMTKDNIGVAVVLEVHKELFGAGEYDLKSSY